MAQNYLELNRINHNFETYSYENVLKELNDRQDSDGLRLLTEHRDTFPALYGIKNRHLDDDVQFSFKEVDGQAIEIVPQSWDIQPENKRLELECDMPDAGKFSISVLPVDSAGEERGQLSGRINFSDETIENLNADRLQKILEFCEQHGFPVWQMSLPYKDGVIDVDEKLAMLTRDFIENRERQSQENPGPNVGDEDESVYMSVVPEYSPVETAADNTSTQAKPKAKKPVTIDDIRKELIDVLEKDLHRTRGLSYFEHSLRMSKRKTYEFSLYEKADRNNEKNDGCRDKNDNPVPTYQYRLYVSQDSRTGEFYFGIATPGGKKIDDAMAGDFLGVVKKTGATHINFTGLHNLEKGVWLTACAEKGLVPIGISINVPKAKKMVEAAKNKLTSEELIKFKRNLAEQMIENAAKKSKDKGDKMLGLSKSEWSFIESLRAGYDFENFRQAYEDDNGLYAAVIEQIDKGSKDEKEGAATTFGGMQTLRTVFDIYHHYQKETFGDYLNNSPASGPMALTTDERRKLQTIDGSKPMTQLSTNDFMLMYNTLLPRHIEDSKKQIIQALEREDSRKGPKRAASVVLSSDLFPKVKGALNEINLTLTRNMGVDALTLPNEHKGLEFLRVDPPKPEQSANTNPSSQTKNQPQILPHNAGQSR